MNREKLIRAILFGAAALLVVGCLFWVILRSGAEPSGGARAAVVTVDGETVMEIDLDGAEDQTISLEEFGVDISLEIKDGAIRFESSDCPDKICVNTGFISGENDIAVCMPNRTAVYISVE